MEAPRARAFPWHRPLIERALRARRDDRLPQALLVHEFSARDPADFALYLSMVLLCDEPGESGICDRCDACRLMRGGTYADFTLVTLEYDQGRKKLKKNISIEQIRNLIYEVSLTPSLGRLRIAVVVPAETMNRASANALLKTLEEPAPGVLLLLATHNPGRLPVTLRSRCQTWRVQRPPRAQALAWLVEQGLDDAEAARYLDHAHGDPALALDLEQGGYAATVERFRVGLGGYLRGDAAVADLCQDLARNEPPTVRRLVDMTLSAYCLQTSGVDAAGAPAAGADAARARELFALRTRAERQLRTEDTNLDMQIQLEDVLISLKQILTRS